MRYAHTNLIADDWRMLSKFYQNTFGCRPVGPQRDLRGRWLDDVTGIENAHLEGEHLLLPGYGENGPTLEIFSYPENRASDKAINSSGFSHLAFEVADVKGTVNRLVSEGALCWGRLSPTTMAQWGWEPSPMPKTRKGI